jgi:ABC transport system ATP-binding/permease protein
MAGWILQGLNDTPVIIRLLPGSVRTLGRTPGADFILDAALVSRLHCRLTADRSDQLVIEDLRSTNGTMVNGTRVERHLLKPGDRVTIGRVDFEVVQG